MKVQKNSYFKAHVTAIKELSLNPQMKMINQQCSDMVKRKY